MCLLINPLWKIAQYAQFNGQTYYFVYSISKALAGSAGAQGAQGDQGDPGQRIKTVSIYKLNDSSVGAPSAGTFADPLNGQEAGWQLTPPSLVDDGDICYVSTRTFTDDTQSPQDPTWSTPTVYSRREDGKVGWSHDLTFDVQSPSDTTVGWSTGTIKTVSSTYNISPADSVDLSGSFGSTYYIYLDVDTSTTALVTSTTMIDAVGQNKILIAVARAESGREEAYFQVFGGKGGIKIAGDEIAGAANRSKQY